MKQFFISILLSLIIWPAFTYADKASELKTQIDSRQAEIAKLDAQIASFEKDLNATSKQAGTLQNALATLNLTIKKLDSQAKKTETEISASKLKIDELNLNIKKTSGNITEHEQAMRELLRELNHSNREGITEAVLGYERLSDFWAGEVRLENLEEAVQQSAQELRTLKTDLGVKVDTTEKEKKKLEGLKLELLDQKKIADAERVKQTVLLAQTKNQEANYKKLLATSRTQREAFAKELFEFESQLKLAIDTSALPTARKGILAWPVANPQITQAFGKTVDAKRLYASGTHNGIDLRASVGTAILSAASGVVAGTGDTDLTCRGASYGKWVLVKHDNGLATLYAHLSLIKVAANQRLAESQLLGYSGQTGYATGPHLHFTVGAATGVAIQSFKSKVCAGTYTMPIFDTRAYLDPILYL
ncbi:MAG: peptidoglycan DD-metalloendopeptidase family protein [Patescibacteria group bacterium]